MTQLQIDITGLDPLVATLARDLSPTLKAISLAVAAAAQDKIAPYPSQPAPRSPRSRYVRGLGTVYSSGKTRRTSENLGRRWNIRPVGLGSRLENTASYAPWVHDKAKQTRQHAGTGWKTDQGVADQLQSDGTVEKIATQAVKKAFGL